MKVAKKNKDNKDLVFVGLTGEGKEKLAKTKKWLKAVGAPWAVAIGSPSLSSFKIKYYPTTMVIGKDGKIAWTDASGGDVEAAIKKALEAKSD